MSRIDHPLGTSNQVNGLPRPAVARWPGGSLADISASLGRPSGADTRLYVGLENAEEMTAIDTLTNRVIANLPTSQAPQVVIGVCGVIRYIERVRAERSAPIVRPTCVLCIA